MKTSGRVKACLQDQIKAEGIRTRRLLFLFFDRIIARIPTMTPCRKQTDEIKRKLPRAPCLSKTSDGFVTFNRSDANVSPNSSSSSPS